ncbi:MAG: hypothetical protein RMY34_19405 [Aulosira sp. DedQUE10]|nr:hypothetical protein [Aulosira sp. DedQUE10]
MPKSEGGAEEQGREFLGFYKNAGIITESGGHDMNHKKSDRFF